MKTHLLRGLFALLLFLQITACGTLMFEERRGQSGGKIDPNVVILDGLGLLFFIVPGLVAYIVDFTTGAIYLPPGEERGEGPFFD
ncbi:MAG: hypothetical protein AB1726_15420 [Planctomycetota bacterium]